MLANNPLIGRERPEFRPDLRSYGVGSYIIFYRQIAAGIEIMRVVHGARDLDAIFETG